MLAPLTFFAVIVLTLAFLAVAGRGVAPVITAADPMLPLEAALARGCVSLEPRFINVAGVIGVNELVLLFRLPPSGTGGGGII